MRSLKNIFFISKITISKREFVFLISIFILAINLRILYLKDYNNIKLYYPVLKESDSYFYLKWAQDISYGDIIGKKVFMKWPLYAYFLAILLKIFNYDLLYVYLFQFFLGSLNCILIYLIARKLFSKIAGVSAVLFYLFYGLFIFYEGLLLYTGLSIFLNLILFLYILYLRDNFNRKGLFRLGLFLGICTLTQANIIIFGLLAIVSILLEKRLTLKRYVYNLAVFIFGLMIILIPVSVRNYIVGKDWVFLSGHLGFNFYLGNNPHNPKGIFYYPFYINPQQEAMFRDARVLANMETGKTLKPSEVSDFWFRKAIQFIIKNPFIYLKILFNKFINLFSPKEYIHDWEFYGIKHKIRVFKIIPLNLNYLIVFFYLGLIWGIKKLKENYLLYLALISFSFSIILFFVATRYRMTMVPYLIIFAGYGLVETVRLFFQKRYLRFLIILTMVLFLSIIFNFNIKEKKNIAVNLVEHLEKVMHYRNSFDYPSALREAETACKSEPNNPLLLNMLGEIHYNLGNFDKAVDIFQKIILNYPFFVDAYYNLGLIYNRQAKFQEAKDVLLKAISLDPEDIPAHFELGRAYKGLGEKIKAKQEFWFVLNNIDISNREDRLKLEKEFMELIEQ